MKKRVASDPVYEYVLTQQEYSDLQDVKKAVSNMLYTLNSFRTTMENRNTTLSSAIVRDINVILSQWDKNRGTAWFPNIENADEG